jgi:hypothetical protein
MMLRFIVLLFIVQSCSCLSQNKILDSIEELHTYRNYKDSKELLERVRKSKWSNYDHSRFLYLEAQYKINNGESTSSCYATIIEAKKLIPKDSLNLLFKVNDELIYLYSSQISSLNSLELQDSNCSIAYKTGDPRQQISCDFYKLSRINSEGGSYNDKLKIIHNSIDISTKNNLKDIVNSLYQNLAVIHIDGNQLDSALYYQKRILPFYESLKNNAVLKDLYNNIGFGFQKSGEIDSALTYFHKGLKLQEESGNSLYKEILHRNIAETYLKNDDFKNSAIYFQNALMIIDSMRPIDTAKNIEELETKYQSAEKDIEIAERKALNEKNRTVIIALSAAAAIILLIAILIYLDIRRKKQIAEKARELETQRADNLFKEQELVTIDAMIAGQESERNRISEDLHDNLGSSLTTIKLYFENLKSQIKDPQAKTVFDKTEILLAETYENVRTMSHARGNGLLASLGLIPAVQELALRINNFKELEFKIHHFGLDQRLENSVELTIFRILQELTTNIVKHSGANEASINITSHTDSINIMVEDNGKGFNAWPLSRKSGMGLSSIEKRVEKLEGTFIVDSTPGRGTTVTIDIPLL